VFAILLSLDVKFTNPYTFQKNTKFLKTCCKVAPFRYNICCQSWSRCCMPEDLQWNVGAWHVQWSCSVLNDQLFLQPQFITDREYGLSELWRPVMACKTQVGLHVKCLLFPSNFNQNWKVLINCRKHPSMKFYENPWGISCGCSMQTDLTRLIVAFCNFCKLAWKMESNPCWEINNSSAS
jgi:hypothetical protein